MQSIKWRLSSLLSLIFVVAVACAAYQGFWDAKKEWRNWPNYNLLFTIYLAALSTASLGAVWGRPSLRRFCAGYALFSWLFLVTVLRGGFISADSEADWLLRTSGFGAMVAVICGMIANWILPFGFSCSSKSAQTKSDRTA